MTRYRNIGGSAVSTARYRNVGGSAVAVALTVQGGTTGSSTPAGAPYFYPNGNVALAVPANPTIEANSAAVVSIMSTSTPQATNPVFGAMAGANWYVTSTNADPLITLTKRKATFYGPVFSFHIPAAERITWSGNANDDGFLNVVNTDTGEEANFWQATFDGTTLTCNGADAYFLDGDGITSAITGTSPGAASGSGCSLMYGTVLQAELAAGVIPHAVRFGCGNNNNTFIAPANKSDGVNTGVNTNPMGMRLQLDPTINLAAISGISQFELIMGTAMQQYGLLDCDSTGGQPVSLYIAADTSYVTGLGGATYAPGNTVTFPHLDFTRLRWVDPVT
jgi:hypothetical protein